MGLAFFWMMAGIAHAVDVGEVASPLLRTSVLMHLETSHFAFVPAGPERPALGPSAIAAGPRGVALIDPAARRLLLIESGAIAEVPLPMVPDSVVAGSDGRWYVLVGRSVWTLGVDGQRESEFALPDLVPSSVTLAVEDGWVVADDSFGNHRPLFGVEGAPWKGGALVEPEQRVRKVPGGVEANGVFFPIKGQRRSGRRLGDWLIVESAATDDSGSIEVERWAIHLLTGSRIDIPTRGRRWVPTVDLSVDPAGALWILSPTMHGLDLVKVQP